MSDLLSRRGRRTSLAARACVNCRKRKSRCSGSAVDGQPCSYCARTGKECSFEEPADRTPLKRKNLDAAERRYAQLRSLLHSLNPDLDIDAALAKLDVAVSSSDGHGPPDSGPRSAHVLHAGRGVVSTGEGDGEGEDDDEGEREREREGEGEGEGDETEEARYGWHEDFRADAAPEDGTSCDAIALRTESQEDGMGTFSTSDSGYLGSSSASSLLQDIASLLPVSDIAGVGGATNAISPNAPSHHSTSSPSGPKFDRPDLASSAAVNLFVDAYFLFYNTSYPIVHEKSFRAKAATDWRQNRKHSAWSIVYYMVLAIGHYVSATISTPRMPSPFYNAARSRMSIAMLEAGSLETLQAFLLMGNYLQKRDRPNTGYNLIGIACRIALGLGLHREPPNAVDNMLHERRRQLFWTVYCFDSGFNITTGRPPSVNEAFIDTRLPRNVDDNHCTLTTGAVLEVEHPTPYSAIIAQAQLAKIADAIYGDFLMAKTRGAKISYQVADRFERTLRTWREQLPHYFISPNVPNWFLGPRAVVLWKFQNLRVLLWRGVEKEHPFLPSRPDANSRCIDVATQAIHEIADFCQQFEEILHLGINWYATYFLFQATLILEAGRLNVELHHDIDGQELWQASITKSRSCLELLAKKSSSASRFLEVLDRIHDHHFPVFAAPSQPTSLNMNVPPASTSSCLPQTGSLFQDESFLLDGMLGNFPGSHQTHLDAAGFSPSEFIADPTIRMLIDQMPLHFLDEQQRNIFDP